MTKEDEVKQLMEYLKIADKHIIGTIMSARGHWTAGTSASNNAYKILSDLADLNQLEKCRGFFRVSGCDSEYGEHAKMITQALAEILANYPDAINKREHFIEAVALRPDAICLLKKDQMGFCLILEVVNHETEEYLQSKINVWKTWQGATEYLSQLFGYKVPHFEFIALRKGDKLCEKLTSL